MDDIQAGFRQQEAQGVHIPAEGSKDNGREVKEAMYARHLERERAAQKHQHDQLAMASRLEALRLALGTSGDPAIVLSHAKAFAAFLQTGEVA